MRSRSRSNVLLVEILIAVLFFMLSATVLVRVFGGARSMTVRSGVRSRALAEAQNVADTMRAADDMDAALEEMQYRSSHGAWSRDYGDYTLYVTGQTSATGAGELWTGEVSAYYKVRDPEVAMQQDELLFSLSCARYEEVRS